MTPRRALERTLADVPGDEPEHLKRKREEDLAGYRGGRQHALRDDLSDYLDPEAGEWCD